ncbi:MAG: hypothetical protein EON98_03715 [Chitinophagaceae bacterium]|nr:MAG: hypothetical protein EON98_03715 [Chitinophagaceae bacterium]
MKFGLVIFLSLGFLCNACGDGKDQNEPVMKDPSVTQPPSEAIPDSTRIVNDSVIVPDIQPNNGKQVGSSDSIQRDK